jgi:CspA family cold shock protein
MATGKIKWWSSAKGYGFIGPDDGSEDVFLHHSEVPDEDLEQGEPVRYEVEETDKGLSAINVERADEEPTW